MAARGSGRGRRVVGEHRVALELRVAHDECWLRSGVPLRDPEHRDPGIASPRNAPDDSLHLRLRRATAQGALERGGLLEAHLLLALKLLCRQARPQLRYHVQVDEADGRGRDEEEERRQAVTDA